MYSNLLEEYLGIEKIDNTLEENIFDLYSTKENIKNNIEEDIYQDVKYLHNLINSDQDVDDGLKYFLTEEYFFLNDLTTKEDISNSIEEFLKYKENKLENSFEALGRFFTRSGKSIKDNITKGADNLKGGVDDSVKSLGFFGRLKESVKFVTDNLIMMFTGLTRNEEGKWGIWNLMSVVFMVIGVLDIFRFTRTTLRKRKDVEKLDKVFKTYLQDIRRKKFNQDKANKITITALNETTLMRNINTSLNVQNLKKILVPDTLRPINNEKDFNRRINELKKVIAPYTAMYGITIEKNKIVVNKKLIKNIPETNTITSLGYGSQSLSKLSNAGRALLLKMNREVGGDMDTFIQKQENAVKELESYTKEKKETPVENKDQPLKMSKKEARMIIDYNKKAHNFGIQLYCRIAQHIFRNTLNMTANTIKKLYILWE